MGKRGRIPEPAALKKAKGTYQACRDAKNEPDPAILGAPEMPRGMPPAALRRWRAVVPELLSRGTMARTDGGAVEAYCREYARWLDLQERAARTADGIDMALRCGVEARRTHKEVLQPLEVALGLHYAGRSRVKMPEKAKAEDPDDKFLAGGGPSLAIVK